MTTIANNTVTTVIQASKKRAMTIEVPRRSSPKTIIPLHTFTSKKGKVTYEVSFDWDKELTPEQAYQLQKAFDAVAKEIVDFG